jgi:phosphoribosylformylglycinamidine synthase PurS subunit
MRYDVLVEVRLRPGIADPEGATIERALPALGFTAVDEVSVGKAFRFRVDAASVADATSVAAELADRLLANPVIEVARVSVAGASVAGASPHAGVDEAGGGTPAVALDITGGA